MLAARIAASGGPPCDIAVIRTTGDRQLKALGDAQTVGAYAEALTRLFGLTEQAAADARTEDEAADQAARDSRGGRVEPFSPRESRARSGRQSGPG